MKIKGKAVLLRIFIGEKNKDPETKKPLYKRIVEILKENNIAGATVIRGILGFGASSRIHEVSILSLSEDLPVIIEVVDYKEKIEEVLPKIENLIKNGLITMEDVNVIKYIGKEKG